MKLEWDSKYSEHGELPSCWQPGTVINFHTQKALKNSELKHILKALSNTFNGEEFVVMSIYPFEETKSRYILVLASISNDLVNLERKISIPWPSKITKSVCYIRSMEKITLKFNTSSNEIIKI